MTKFARLSLALALPLAACAGHPVISNSHMVEYYKPQMLGYPAAQGGMYTEITGNPFQGDKAALDRKVTEAFENSHFGPSLAFFTETPAETPAFKTVVLFNPARNANAERLCTSSDRPEAPPVPGEVRVTGALCNGDTRLTSATGFVTGVEGPDDPGVSRLLSQLGLSLFPPAYGVRQADASNDNSYQGGPYIPEPGRLTAQEDEREPSAAQEVQQDPVPGPGDKGT
jgi:hypothetical protein